MMYGTTWRGSDSRTGKRGCAKKGLKDISKLKKGLPAPLATPQPPPPSQYRRELTLSPPTASSSTAAGVGLLPPVTTPVKKETIFGIMIKNEPPVTPKSAPHPLLRQLSHSSISSWSDEGNEVPGLPTPTAPVKGEDDSDIEVGEIYMRCQSVKASSLSRAAAKKTQLGKGTITSPIRLSSPPATQSVPPSSLTPSSALARQNTEAPGNSSDVSLPTKRRIETLMEVFTSKKPKLSLEDVRKNAMRDIKVILWYTVSGQPLFVDSRSHTSFTLPICSSFATP
ncbi:hypothetical protein BC835DRAFT_1413534 [Cytidiella melzeri]|nr:hypothetical protein BC835DRAFT_1413534 [Cytidiella melzeri]